MADSTTTTENQINFWGKLTAGLLLIFFTSAAIYFTMAYWPNKMPPIKDSDDEAWYTRQLFNITLIEKPDSSSSQALKAAQLKMDSVDKQIAARKDSLRTKADTAAFTMLTDSLKKLKTIKANLADNNPGIYQGKRIHLNNILLILVALMGFLGNMVHIASSFTSYVGNGTFLRSWILWYFVKPFTAAGLAIIIYFIIRAGFLSYGSGAAGISLYGIMAMSALAGLFTDSATLKLKEVFEVIFKPKDERTGKLQGDVDFAVASIAPATIPAGAEATLVLTGKGLNMADIKIAIDNAAIKPAVQTAERMEMKYMPTAAAVAAKKAVLLITDKAGKTLYTKDITVG